MLTSIGQTLGAILLAVIGGVFGILAIASAVRALEHGQISKFLIEALLIFIAGFLLLTWVRDAMPWAFPR